MGKNKIRKVHLIGFDEVYEIIFNGRLYRNMNFTGKVKTIVIF